MLTESNVRDSVYWRCVETKGWLGFQNTVSGKFLGHDAKGKLCCSAERHRSWEYFCVRMRPEGIKEEEGVEKLAKTGEGGADGIVWEFTRV